VYALSRRPRVVPVPDIDFEPWFQGVSCRRRPSSLRHWTPISFVILRRFQSRPMLPWAPWAPAFWRFCTTSTTRRTDCFGYLCFSCGEQDVGEGPRWKSAVCWPGHAPWRRRQPLRRLPHIQGEQWCHSCVCPAVPHLYQGGILVHPHVAPSLLIKEFPMPSPSLSIQEFPVKASEGRIPKPLFCPLGKGSFCSIGKPNCPKEDQVILTFFQIENIDPILNACQSVGTTCKSPYKWRNRDMPTNPKADLVCCILTCLWLLHCPCVTGTEDLFKLA